MADKAGVETLAQSLGWFSVGLGLTEVLATKGLTEYLGMEKKAALVRFFGFREIGAGIGLLTQSRPAPWLWARVGGDALDLAALASALTASNSKRRRVGVALAIVAAITVVDIFAAQKAGRAQAEDTSEETPAAQVSLEESARADDPAQDSARHDDTHEVAPHLAYQRLGIVNVAFYGLPGAGDRQWVLIDTGIPGMAGHIRKAAGERFGEGSRPAAIIMTHGHFDHVGTLQELSEGWDAPIYAHALERPYLDGTAAYPPPDPTVGGGLMPLLSPMFPRDPVDVSPRLSTLPADGSVPGMPGWRWLHTPGHAPGHVSLWREADRALIAGDAFVTTGQESVYAVAIQQPQMHGPPMYFTPDWVSAKASVETLAALEPELAVTGHGRAMQGPEMRAALHTLARDFDQVAVPKHGQYVLHPATADDGTAYVLPSKH